MRLPSAWRVDLQPPFPQVSRFQLEVAHPRHPPAPTLPRTPRRRLSRSRGETDSSRLPDVVNPTDALGIRERRDEGFDGEAADPAPADFEP